MGVVVFDGDCGFCTWAARRLHRMSSGRLVTAPWQSTDLALLGLTAEQCSAAVQLVEAGRRYSSGAAVARALLSCKQPWRTVGRLLGAPAVAPLTARAYELVAAHRHRLPGSTPACRTGDRA